MTCICEELVGLRPAAAGKAWPTQPDTSSEGSEGFCRQYFESKPRPPGAAGLKLAVWRRNNEAVP